MHPSKDGRFRQAQRDHILRPFQPVWKGISADFGRPARFACRWIPFEAGFLYSHPTMSKIERLKRDHYFTSDRRWAQDETLSYKARGIMSYVMSRPDDWQIWMKDLINQSEHDGRHAVRSGIKELVDKGYAKRVRVKNNETGEFEGKRTLVREATDLPWPVEGQILHINGEESPNNGFSEGRDSPNDGFSHAPETRSYKEGRTERKDDTRSSSLHSSSRDADASEDDWDWQSLQENSTGGDQVPQEEVEITSNDLVKSAPEEEEVPREEIIDLVRAVDDADDLGSMGWRLGVLFRRLFAPWWDDEDTRQNLSRLLREAKRLRGESAPDGTPMSQERAYVECAKALAYLYHERDDLHGRVDDGARKDQPTAALNVLSKHISLEFENTEDEDDGEMSQIEKALQEA